MPDLFALTAIGATFLIAGGVKGVIGLGLPTVSLALLSVLFDLPSAMALLLVPSFVTNLWQGVVGGNGAAILRRIWPFLILATGTVWIGAIALRQVDLSLLSALLGVSLMVYAAANLAGMRIALTAAQDRWAGPLLGTVNGLLTGMTGSFVVPGVMYLQALGLPRDMLIQAMGILFTASTAALAVALQRNAFLSPELALLSLGAVPPAIIGMMAGQRLRRTLSEQLFRRVFFIALLILGAYIIVRALGGAGH